MRTIWGQGSRLWSEQVPPAPQKQSLGLSPSHACLQAALTPGGPESRGRWRPWPFHSHATPASSYRKAHANATATVSADNKQIASLQTMLASLTCGDDKTVVASTA